VFNNDYRIASVKNHSEAHFFVAESIKKV